MGFGSIASHRPSPAARMLPGLRSPCTSTSDGPGRVRSRSGRDPDVDAVPRPALLEQVRPPGADVPQVRHARRRTARTTAPGPPSAAVARRSSAVPGARSAGYPGRPARAAGPSRPRSDPSSSGTPCPCQARSAAASCRASSCGKEILRTTGRPSGRVPGAHHDAAPLVNGSSSASAHRPVGALDEVGQPVDPGAAGGGATRPVPQDRGDDETGHALLLPRSRSWHRRDASIAAAAPLLLPGERRAPGRTVCDPARTDGRNTGRARREHWRAAGAQPLGRRARCGSVPGPAAPAPRPRRGSRRPVPRSGSARPARAAARLPAGDGPAGRRTGAGWPVVDVDLLRVRPPAGLEEAANPLGAPPPAPATAGAFAFTGLQPDGGGPVAYSPCRPIHYVVRPDGAPPAARSSSEGRSRACRRRPASGSSTTARRGRPRAPTARPTSPTRTVGAGHRSSSPGPPPRSPRAGR